MVDRARVHAGMRVLVHAGASVFATARAANAAYVRSIGATPIDYTTTSVGAYVAEHTGGDGFDLVYDTVGGTTLDASFAAVARFGHVVSCLGWGTHALAPLSFKAGTYSGVFTLLPLLTGIGRERHGEILREAATLVERGELTPRIDPREFALMDAADAHAALTSGEAQGKIVVSVG